MSEEFEIVRVLEEVAKHGVSAKTNKEWSMARVELSNGEGVFIFNPIQVGDKVKSVQNGDFTNYQLIKADPKHDEIMSALKDIQKMLKDKDVGDIPNFNV